MQEVRSFFPDSALTCRVHEYSAPVEQHTDSISIAIVESAVEGHLVRLLLLLHILPARLTPNRQSVNGPRVRKRSKICISYAC